MAHETNEDGTRTARVQCAAGTTSAAPVTAAGAASATPGDPSSSASMGTNPSGSTGTDAMSGSKTEQAKAVAVDAKGRVKDQALGLKDKALGSARSAADSGKTMAVEKVGGVSRALEASATKLDEDVGKTYGDFARTAARSIDDFAAQLDGKNVEDLLEEAKSFVRKSPAIAIGIAAVLGFAASRVVKSGLDLDNDA